MAINQKLLGAVAGAAMLTMGAGEAFARCNAYVETVQASGTNVTVTFRTHVEGYGPFVPPSGPYVGHYTNASTNDVAAIRALIDNRREGTGIDTNSHLHIEQRKLNACNDAFDQANRLIIRLIRDTPDPVARVEPAPRVVVEPTPRVVAVPPVGTTEREPVIIKPRETTPVVVAEPRVCTAPAQRVIQLGIPCNCENGQIIVRSVQALVEQNFGSQVDEIVVYNNPNLDAANGVQIAVSVTDIVGDQPRFHPTQTFITVGGVVQPTAGGVTLDAFLRQTIAGAGARPQPATIPCPRA